MKKKILESKYFYRFGEAIVPFLSWVLITFPIWFSFFHPAVVAYFILAFDLYFLYKAWNTTYHSVISYRELNRNEKINYRQKLIKLKKGKEIEHFIIIPNYKEPIYKLKSTIEAIITNDFPYKNLHLVLAFEKREEEEAQKKEKEFRELYGSYFKSIIAAYHVISPGEVPGKASNQTFAAKIADQYVQDQNLDPENILFTTCDADSRFPSNYFSYLTYTYLRDRERIYHFYWAPVLLYGNFWDLPFFVRMQATLSSVLRVAFASQKDQLIQISTYSTSLWLLRKVGFWDVDIIPEDWHIFYQAYFTLGTRVKTIPLYTLINGDAAYSGEVVKTFKNRYEQEKRWAWGVSDVSYVWNKLFVTPHIPFMAKFKKITYLAETHLLWPTSFFILTLSASVPPLVNPVFKRTVLGFLLPQLSGLILTLASVMIIFYIYLDIILRKKMDIKTKAHKLLFIFAQWYLLPLVSFLLSSLPALEAHTRLLLGKKITYKVTEKV